MRAPGNADCTSAVAVSSFACLAADTPLLAARRGGVHGTPPAGENAPFHFEARAARDVGYGDVLLSAPRAAGGGGGAANEALAALVRLLRGLGLGAAGADGPAARQPLEPFGADGLASGPDEVGERVVFAMTHRRRRKGVRLHLAADAIGVEARQESDATSHDAPSGASWSPELEGFGPIGVVPDPSVVVSPPPLTLLSEPETSKIGFTR